MKNRGMGYNYGFQQEQCQMLNQQQAIDQSLSHDILFQLLSTAELYALGKDGNRKFKGYEFFNSSSKSKSKLKDQLLIQTDTFKNSYRFFVHDHETYEFPENLDRKMVIDLMAYWKSLVDAKDRDIYDITINLLSGKKDSKTITVKHKKDYKKQEDLNDVQMGNLADIMTKVSYSNYDMGENAIKNLNQNGKYKGKVILGANGPVDPTLAKIYGNGNINTPIEGKTYPKSIDDYEN